MNQILRDLFLAYAGCVRGSGLKNVVITICCALACLLSAETSRAQASELGSGTTAPSKESVRQWWSMHSGEDMELEGDLIEVRLQSRELAYLAPASFFGRGRNDISHMVLVRPALKEVREMPFPMRSAKVLDLDHDGVSEVVATQVLSGQGTDVIIDSILHINGWTPKLLHQVKSGDNFGACMTPPDEVPCKRTKVDWQFQDSNGPHSVVLTETVSTTTGAPSQKMLHHKKGLSAPTSFSHEAVMTAVNSYYFTGDRFVRLRTRRGQ